MCNDDPDIAAFCAAEQPEPVQTLTEQADHKPIGNGYLRERVIELEQALKDLPGELGEQVGIFRNADYVEGVQDAMAHVQYIIGRLGLNE